MSHDQGELDIVYPSFDAGKKGKSRPPQRAAKQPARKAVTSPSFKASDGLHDEDVEISGDSGDGAPDTKEIGLAFQQLVHQLGHKTENKRKRTEENFSRELKKLKTDVQNAIEQRMAATTKQLDHLEAQMKAKEKQLGERAINEVRGHVAELNRTMLSAESSVVKAREDLVSAEESAKRIASQECKAMREFVEEAIAKHKADTRMTTAEHALPHRELFMTIDELFIGTQGNKHAVGI